MVSGIVNASPASPADLVLLRQVEEVLDGLLVVAVGLLLDDDLLEAVDELVAALLGDLLLDVCDGQSDRERERRTALDVLDVLLGLLAVLVRHEREDLVLGRGLGRLLLGVAQAVGDVDVAAADVVGRVRAVGVADSNGETLLRVIGVRLGLALSVAGLALGIALDVVRHALLALIGRGRTGLAQLITHRGFRVARVGTGLGRVGGRRARLLTRVLGLLCSVFGLVDLGTDAASRDRLVRAPLRSVLRDPARIAGRLVDLIELRLARARRVGGLGGTIGEHVAAWESQREGQR